MKNGIKRGAFLLLAGLLICFWARPAEATRSFTMTQTPASAEFSMGTAQTATFLIANTSNAGETVTRVQFNVSGTYTFFPPQTITMSGWTCALSNATGSNYRRITCSANSTGDRIAPGSSNTYALSFINNTANSSTDRTDSLSSVVTSFWTGTRTRSTTMNNQGGWTWKALLVTLVSTPASVGTGCQFTLTMTVTNKSTANGLAISPVPSPRPAVTATGGATVNNPSPVSIGFPLNAGASGTFTWTYTVSGSAGGTVRFTACASTGANCTTTSGTSRTSSSVTSSPMTIAAGLSCGLTSAITNSPACLFPGNTATFVMIVTNTTGATVANVVPSALTRVVTGAAVIGAFTGPAPATIASIPANGTGTFTWTAPVTGNPNDQYSVSGYATANGPIQTATIVSTPVQDVDGYLVSVGTTNENSANAELTWTVTNYGCSNINQVAIAAPGGWPAATDPYALVSNTTGTQVVDSWTPLAGTTFTSPNVTDSIPVPPLANTGTFSLVFSPTPAAGTYTFNVTITDATLPVPMTTIIPTVVTVNPFDSSSGGPNEAGTAVWHEDMK